MGSLRETVTEKSDRFWPLQTGPLTPMGLADQSSQVLSELASYADKMIAVKGLNYAFSNNGCGHSGGGNQCLTAAQVSSDLEGPSSLAMGESIDNYIARHFPNNGGEPLTLYTGPRHGYIEEVLSYRGPKLLRSAESDPWIAYQRMLGTDGGAINNLVFERRQSVNDLIKDQLNDLMNRNDLSTQDKQRLELHFDSIRDFERLACTINEDEQQSMATLSGLGHLDDNRILFAKMHMDLIALAFSCDFARAATLQIGDGNDGTEYTIDGQRLPSFHYVSHRIYSDGSDGEAIAGAEDMHHAIDRLMAKTFLHLLDRLNEYGVIDQTQSVWCSDLGNGVSHSYNNVPYVVVGGANGALNRGQFLDLGGTSHEKLFNTLITASEIRTPSGERITNFGDPSLEGGLIEEMLS